MRKTVTLTLATMAAAALTGCGSTGLLSRDRPDEFAVQRQAPLVVPPDFSLTPPAPGAPRPTEGTAAEQALDVLFGGPAPRSQVETSALERAGAADPGIRTAVGDPQTNTVAKGRVTRDIIAAPEGDGAGASAVIPG
ncbi:hypothetical protein GCM10011515_25700 [Tsuneonella deserti]|uniref:DUF3035 domain-containing protein n=1 Tax=Tsuneonella deserti TaxID=2035528 RepID=A0ABQ1SE06_9SPHN|nr:DUF3035 domain-containing protein [Tsuneonella deserti]GGE04986.1 hypothetical protein GCM10011515_25700 [Tsuneonella deserti]